MNWMEVDEMTAEAPLPAGYRYELLKRSEIPALVCFINQWFPDISVGGASCYVRDDFYRERVSLAGEAERDTLVILIKSGQELVGLFSLAAGAAVAMAATRAAPANRETPAACLRSIRG